MKQRIVFYLLKLSTITTFWLVRCMWPETRGSLWLDLPSRAAYCFATDDDSSACVGDETKFPIGG